MSYLDARGEDLDDLHAPIGVSCLIARRRAPEMLARRSVVVSLETGERTIACEVIRSRGGLCYAQASLGRTPRRSSATSPGPNDFAAALGLNLADIGFAAHEPSRFADRRSHGLCPIASRAALIRARFADARAFSRLLGDAAGLFLYAADPIAPDAAIHARYFDARGEEQPASAEAIVAFAGAAQEFERPPDGAHEFVIEQGHCDELPGTADLAP